MTPGLLFAKQQLSDKPDKKLLVIVSNIPELYQEKNMERFFRQKITDFTCFKLLLDNLSFGKRRV